MPHLISYLALPLLKDSARIQEHDYRVAIKHVSTHAEYEKVTEEHAPLYSEEDCDATVEKMVVVERNKWVEKEEFLDLLALAQSAPGVFAVNIAIFIGYKLRGLKGAIFASLGSALPSVVCILLIAIFFRTFRENQIVEYVFRGIRPAVVALVAAPVFSVAKTAKIPDI